MVRLWAWETCLASWWELEMTEEEEAPLNGRAVSVDDAVRWWMEEDGIEQYKMTCRCWDVHDVH